MAIEILKRGCPPEDDVFEVTCRRCKSELRFKRSDAKFTADQRDGDFLTISCPVCNESVHTSARKLFPPTQRW